VSSLIGYLTDFSGDDVVFPQGYSQLTEFLASDLDIRLNQVVEQVSYDANGTSIRTQDGQTYQADYTLVTVPLGVLKSDLITFEPSLPTLKQQAINRLGMGLLNKAYLKFPSAFWGTESDFLGYVSETRGRWNTWVNMAHYIDEPILMGFNSADYGRAIEAWTDEEIIADAMDVLRSIYGDDIPEPTEWQITRWASDPYALGSYSYYAVGSTPEDRIALDAPVMNRLFFAGEATRTDHPSTVHGAFMSGEDQAQRILSL